MRTSAKRPTGRTEIGDRLRGLRSERSLTLSDIAGRSGVSISNLSKIERGEVSPSFDVIIRICEGLDIALEQFVQPGPKATTSGRKTATRQGEAVGFVSGQYSYLAHATELSRKTMTPLEIRVRARSAGEFDHWSQHAGEEFVYVISGAIEIHTEHYAPFGLAAGESAYFDSAMRHIYVSTGQGDAHVLSVSHAPVDHAALTDFMVPDALAATPQGAGNATEHTAPQAMPTQSKRRRAPTRTR